MTRAVRGWTLFSVFLLGTGMGMFMTWRKTAPLERVFHELRVAGVIDIRPDLKKYLKSSDVLFIIVTQPGSPMPLAVKRIVSFQLPLVYSIGPRDRMIPARSLGGSLPMNHVGEGVQLTARIDKDGEANPTQPGDLIGKANGGRPFAVPAGDVHVLIDTVVQASNS